MNLSEMKQLLARDDIQLTRSLGQNFLHDGNQLRRIVDAAELTERDKVLEIGPGLGPLTELLLAHAGRVLAVEKDARLVAVLHERFASQLAGPSLARASAIDPAAPGQRTCSPFLSQEGQGGGGGRSDAGETNAPVRRPALHLLHEDALEFLKRASGDWREWKLVANLPYSVASPILVELAQMPSRPERMVVTLQIEVARRLMAGTDDDDYGLLTLLVQLDYEPRGWFKIPASCFFPAPDVDSACVVLVRRSMPLLPDEHRAVFVKAVKRALSQRRKMMAKLLKTDWPLERLQTAMASLNLSPQIRAEKVSLQKFVDLTRFLSGR
jgi:16S rRNA (adenine1518-N6/adenine1519-N6)-dimethyltransferase